MCGALEQSHASAARKTTPCQQPTCQPKEEAKLYEKPNLREYICNKKERKQRICRDPSWTHEKETSNALFVHGHHGKCRSPPIRYFSSNAKRRNGYPGIGRVEVKPLKKANSSADRRHDRYIKLRFAKHGKMHAYYGGISRRSGARD